MKTKFEYIFILIISLNMLSCGFKLRNYNTISNFKTLNIKMEQKNLNFSAILTTTLKANHIKFSYHKAYKNVHTLIIHEVSKSEQLTAVSSSTTPRQYLLTARVKYSLLDNKDRTLINEQNIITIRQITINNDRILGSEMEKNIIYNQALPDLCDRLLQKINNI